MPGAFWESIWLRLDLGLPMGVEADVNPLSDDPDALLLTPTAPLEVGGRYALSTQDCEGDVHTGPVPSESSVPQTVYAEFTVTEAAPLPEGKFALEVGGLTVTSVQLGGGAGCAGPVESATVLVEIDDADEPWADAIAWETRVDGNRYRSFDHRDAQVAFGFSWVGHGRDLLVAPCTGADVSWLETDVVLAGAHTVQMVGSIPGTEHRVQTETVMVELPSCSVIDGGAGDSGTDGDRDAAEDRPQDAGARDGSAGEPPPRGHDTDAASPRRQSDPADPLAAGDDVTAVPQAEKSGGCDCAVPASGPSPGGVRWWVLAVAIAMGRRVARPR